MNLHIEKSKVNKQLFHEEQKKCRVLYLRSTASHFYGIAL